MSAMDHAAAHERIEDLLLEPARLAALAASTEAADVALRDHVAGCATCRADLDAWRQLQRRLAVALPGSAEAAAAAVERIEAPPSLRATVISAVREADRAATPTPTSVSTPTPMVRVAARSRAAPVARSRRRPLATWLGVAASVAVLVGSVAITLDQVNQRSMAEAQAAGLARTVAAVDRVLVAPEHWVVELKDASGGAGGSISWSSQDLVVLTTALAAPPTGQRYACWLVEGDSAPSMIGMMYFAGRTAYWAGTLDEWATFRIGPNTRFAVTLQPTDSTTFAGPIYLSAKLGA